MASAPAAMPTENLLNIGTNSVKKVEFVSRLNRIVVLTYTTSPVQSSIHVFDVRTKGEPILILNEHNPYFMDIVHLHDGIMGSIHENGDVFTWDVCSGRILGHLKLQDCQARSIVKLGSNSNMVIIGTRDGNMDVVSHDDNGLKLKHVRRISAHSELVFSTTVHEDILVTTSLDKTAIVWDAKTLEKRADLDCRVWFRCIAINNRQIVAGGADGKLYIYDNNFNSGEQYRLVKKLDLRNFYHNGINQALSLEFVDEDSNLLMVTSCWEGIIFISLSSPSVLAQVAKLVAGKVAHGKKLAESCVLSDGKICVGGMYAYCAIVQLPPQVKQLVTEYATRKYDACRVASSPIGSPTPTSLPARMVPVAATPLSIVPAQIAAGPIISRATPLPTAIAATASDPIASDAVRISTPSTAPSAPIVSGDAGFQMLRNAWESRLSQSAICVSEARPPRAACTSDAKSIPPRPASAVPPAEKISAQNTWKRTVSAPRLTQTSCVSDTESKPANSPTPTTWKRNGSEPRLTQTSCVSDRSAIESRLAQATCLSVVYSDEEPIMDEGEDQDWFIEEKPSAADGNKDDIETEAGNIKSRERTAAAGDVDIEDANSELRELKELENIVLNKSTILKLPPTKLAAVLAAYFVSYDAEMGEEYVKMKKCLLAFFKRNLISGVILVKARKEVVRKRLDDMIGTICKNLHDGAAMRDSIEVLLALFMESINTSDGAA